MQTTQATLDVHDMPPVPYVRRDDYLDGSFEEGLVQTSEGIRLVVLPEDLLIGLHRALKREAGAAWSLVAYTCGRRWGERLLATIESEWRTYYGESFDHADFPVFEAWLSDYFSFYGWGDIDLDFSKADEGVVQFWLEDSVLDLLLEDLDETYVNEIFAGVLAAMVSRLAGREVECLEVESVFDGADRSRIVAAIPERIEEARRVRVDGGDVDEMLSILTH